MQRSSWGLDWVGLLLFGIVGLLTPADAANGGMEQKAVQPMARRVLGHGNGKLTIYNTRTNTVEWQIDCSGVAHDLHQLANGNVLTQTGANNVVEFDKAGKIVWRYDAKPKEGYNGRVEIHAFERLKNGRTMIAESGNERILEVDAGGKILRETPLFIRQPDAHRDTRLVRTLENGNYLVCHEKEGVVREYEPQTGLLVWDYKLDLNDRPASGGHDGHGTSVFGAVRLKNGNTLIAGGNANRVIEVNKDGKIVWSVEQDELPGVKLFWVTTLHVLPNGNVIIGNCHAGEANPQIVEVTRDKKIVWTLQNWAIFGNDLAAAQVLDLPKGTRR